SDHVAIIVSFDLQVAHRAPPLRRNFRAADWDEFQPLLDAHLAANPLPALPLSSPAEVDAYTDALTLGITTVLEEHVPLSRPSPYTNRWWCAALSILR
ncbi:hypothetical protein C8R47DRAFT_914971, partial [Mycena vitilis]